MAVFQTDGRVSAFGGLGELSSYLDGKPDVRVVDPGIPLSNFFDGGDFGPAWTTQPSVRKVVGFIARHVSSTPLHVYDRVDDTDRPRVRSGALAELVARPSRAPGVTRMRFWESLLIDGLLHDRWCALKVQLDDGGTELARIPAYRTRFNSDGLGRLETVSIRFADGTKQDLGPDRFVLDYGYSERGANGTSPLVTMRHLLDEASEAVQYRRDIWQRGARVPAVVEREQKWPPNSPARDRFIAALQSFQRGGGREGQTLLLEDGMKYQAAPAFNPQEVADLEGRRLTDIEVCSSYYIAPELLGIREGNYSNIDAFRQMLWGPSLGPYVVAWEQALNASLVPALAPGSDLYVEANVEAKLRGSFEDQAKYLQTATGAPYLTRNEARARLNLASVAGGDELVVPLNVLTGGQASPTDSGTQNQRAAGPVAVKARAPQTHDTKYDQVLTRFFKRQRQVVLSALGAKAAADWWDGKRWDAELAADLFSLAVLTSTEAGKAALAAIGGDADAYDAETTLAFLAVTTDRSAKNINAATQRFLQEALAAGVDDDDPLAGVKGVFDVAEGSRSTAIASSAVTAMSGFGTLEAGKQAGAATKTWSTGANPRSAHAALDGETVPIDEEFSNGLAWPGDSRGDGDDVAGCNCELIINAA